MVSRLEDELIGHEQVNSGSMKCRNGLLDRVDDRHAHDIQACVDHHRHTREIDGALEQISEVWFPFGSCPLDATRSIDVDYRRHKITTVVPEARARAMYREVRYASDQSSPYRSRQAGASGRNSSWNLTRWLT